MAASLESGSPVRANGNVKATDAKRFICSLCSTLYRPPKVKHKEGDYRKDSFVNSEKGGRRKNGQSGPRRTKTMKALDHDSTCKFGFNVKYDDIGFYLDEASGNPYHSNHPKVDPSSLPLSTKLIPEQEKETLIALSESYVGAGVGRNYLHARLGRHISRAKIAYVSSSSCSIPGMECADIDQLLQFFKDSKEISHRVLWDVPAKFLEDQPNVATPTNQANVPCTPHKLCSTFIARDSDSPNEEFSVDHSNSPEYEELQQAAAEQRASSSINPEAKLFICVCWWNVKEMRLFRKFPHLLYCDVTGGTNDTKNHLLTMSGRTPNGKQFIILRCWIHNQKRTTFKWVFQIALRFAVRTSIHKQVYLVLVDGDPQQYGEVYVSIQDYLTSAIIGLCTFHLVNQNWKSNGLSENCVSSSEVAKARFKKFKNLLHSWLYSFARPGYCETEEEFEISKAILYRFLQSEEVKTTLEHEFNVNKVCHWVRNHVLSAERNFSFWRRKARRTYYQTTTSPHEGTNYGMKVHAAAVQPCNSILTAGKKLSLQGTLKLGEISLQTTRLAITNPLWSTSLTANHVIPECESLLLQEMELSQDYAVRWLDATSFEVVHVGFLKHVTLECPETTWSREAEDDMEEDDDEDTEENLTQMVPKFWRVRLVAVSEKGCLTCSCCQYQSTGLPCRHMMALMKFLFPEWKGFTHHAVSLVWWKLWHICAHDPRHVNISVFLQNLMRGELDGPWVGAIPTPPSGLNSSRVSVPAHKRAVNYSEEFLSRLMNFHPLSPGFEGLSQEIHHAEEESHEIQYDHFDDDDSTEDAFRGCIPQQLNFDKANSSRESLKADIGELFACLDSLGNDTMVEEIREHIRKKTSEARVALREKNGMSVGAGTVNIMAERKRNSTRRCYHSKNC